MDLLDIFTYPELRSERGEPQFQQAYTRNLQRYVMKYRRYRPMIAVLSRILTMFRKRRNIDIVFVGTSFLHLMLQASRHSNILCLVQNERELYTAIRHGIPPLLAWKWRAGLNQAYELEDTVEREESLRSVVTDMKAILLDVSPRAIVLSNDSLFLERALVFSAKSAGILTMTIQHGLFMQSGQPHVMDGYWTDHMLVWGDFFRELYSSQEILPEGRIHVLGYPRPLKICPVKSGDEVNVVCLLGQRWEDLASSLVETKLQVIPSLMKACNKLELDFVYRPAPAENWKELTDRFPGLTITDTSETLIKAIERYDVFFSWTSTALLEAALMGRMAVQLRSDDILMDDFEKLGVCYSIENDLNDIEEFLEGVKLSRTFPLSVNKGYVSIPENLGDTFFSIVQSVTDGTV